MEAAKTKAYPDIAVIKDFGCTTCPLRRIELALYYSAVSQAAGDLIDRHVRRSPLAGGMQKRTRSPLHFPPHHHQSLSV